MKLKMILLGAFLLMSLSAAAEVRHASFGTTSDGKPVDVYTLTSPVLEVRIMTYGARILSIEAPDRNGKRDDIVLGYKDLASYEKDTTYFGSIVGRYANRLAGGTFTLDGKQYQVPLNDGPNALHGGTTSFAQRVWTGKEIPNGVEMSLISPDGEMGFPGTLTVHARYVLHGNALRLDITATSDADTVVNLTNHSYFNLSGEGNGTILHDRLTLPADRFVPVDKTLIPTGELKPVAGTPFDFRTPHVVGDRIDTQGDEQLAFGIGYDHSWVLNGAPGTLHEAAKVEDPQTGRTLTVATTQPAVQFYTGNHLPGNFAGSNGKNIDYRGGLCLETHHFPDSPNQPSFPTTELKKGQQFHETTVWTFGVEK